MANPTPHTTTMSWPSSSNGTAQWLLNVSTTSTWYPDPYSRHTTTHRNVNSTIPNDDWQNVNMGIPVGVCIIIVMMLLTTVIVVKQRRRTLRQQGRQHPSRVMAGGPGMSVDAYRSYPGPPPHGHRPQGQGHHSGVTMGIDPAPAYPGPLEHPPSYDDVMRMYPNQPPLLGSSNLGYSHTDVQIDPPGSSTAQQRTTVPSSGESPQHTPPPQSSQHINGNNTRNEGNSNNTPANSADNTSDSLTSDGEKPQPEICADDQVPKPD